MGEPEAGSEFAMRAAAAGEDRRPGFGVTMRHPRGTGRVWTERKIILFLSSIQYPFHIHRDPEAKEPSGQQRVNPEGCGVGAEHPEWWGRLDTHSLLGRAVWRMPWVGRSRVPAGL